jgi:hypothetical protein
MKGSDDREMRTPITREIFIGIILVEIKFSAMAPIKKKKINKKGLVAFNFVESLLRIIFCES